MPNPGGRRCQGCGRDPKRPLTRTDARRQWRPAWGIPTPPPEMGHRPRAKAARHGPAGDSPWCRRRPSIGRPASCGLRGACCAQGPSGAGWVGHPALRAAASPPMSQWGGFGGREQIYGRRCAALVLVSQPPPRPPARGRGVAAGPPASPSMPRGVGPPVPACPRVPRAARPPVPASAPARPRPVAPPPPDRPRCHAASARPGPGPSRVPPRRPGLPVPGRSAAGPRAAPAPGPGGRPASMPVGPRPSAGRLHAARTFNHSYLHRAGNPLFYRVFR